MKKKKGTIARFALDYKNAKTRGGIIRPTSLLFPDVSDVSFKFIF